MALTDLQMLFASFSAWKQNECDDNREAICAAKNVLPVIMEECCTKKQRVYMTAFFIDNLNVHAYFASTVRLFRFGGLPVRFKRSEIIGEAAKLESQYFR